MKFIKEHIFEIITYAVLVVFAVAITAFALWIRELIWRSDLPEWLKFFLLTS